MTDQPSKSKPQRLVRDLLLSFATFNLGYIIDQTVRWTDHIRGFFNGVFHILIHGVGWCVYLLPWSLGVVLLYRWRKWGRFRTQLILAPAVLAFAVCIVGLITHPPSPAIRFRQFAHAELPQSIQNLHYSFAGGGFADYTDMYYFEITPKETDRLIKDMRLHRSQHYGQDGISYSPIQRLPGCPDYKLWQNAELYQRNSDGWFYYLMTDSSRIHVYVLVGCI